MESNSDKDEIKVAIVELCKPWLTPEGPCIREFKNNKNLTTPHCAKKEEQ